MRRIYYLRGQLIGAAVCIYDKLAAPRGWRRVPERTLFSGRSSAAGRGSI